MRRKTVRFSAALSIFLPILAAEAQDVDVPANLTMRHSISPNEGNILKGGVRFIHTFGGVGNNTFIGLNAGNFTTFGLGRNTALGASALQNNTNGFNNTAIGVEALLRNAEGNNNTALGASALQNNTVGFVNTAIGAGALQNNTNGNNNSATGFGALGSNTSGAANTATGVNVLLSNTTGGGNTAIGVGALFGSITGFNNTASGVESLFQNTTGSNNTACGRRALMSNTSGQSNTAIGNLADVSAGNLTNATVIGAGAIVNASNKIRLGNDSVTVIEGLVGFTANSDRNRQENFQPVCGEEVLRKIRDLSLTSWNYVGQEPTRFRHYGPAAQDFFDAFGNDGIGTIGTPNTITSTDIEGILMVAVQALERRTEENDALKARLEALERMVGVVAGR